MLGCYSWSDHRWSGCTTANTSLHNNRVLCIQTKKKEISKTRVSLTALTYVLHTYDGTSDQLIHSLFLFPCVTSIQVRVAISLCYNYRSICYTNLLYITSQRRPESARVDSTESARVDSTESATEGTEGKEHAVPQELSPAW